MILRISFSIVIVFILMCLTAPTYAQKSDGDNSSFSRKELVQLKKEALFSELSLLSNNETENQSLKWQLRILLATFSAALLVLSSSRDNNLAKHLNPMVLSIGLPLLILISFYYDCHLSSLTTSRNNRSRCVKTFLSDLHNKTSAELNAFETHIDVRDEFIKNNPTLCKRFFATIRESCQRKLEYLAYYILVCGLFIVGWHIHRKAYHAENH